MLICVYGKEGLEEAHFSFSQVAATDRPATETFSACGRTKDELIKRACPHPPKDWGILDMRACLVSIFSVGFEAVPMRNVRQGF